MKSKVLKNQFMLLSKFMFSFSKRTFERKQRSEKGNVIENVSLNWIICGVCI